MLLCLKHYNNCFMKIKQIWEKIYSNKKGALIYFILIAISLTLFVKSMRDRFYVTAVFQDLRPFNKRVTVYYNGFVVGHVAKVGPDKDYKATLVTLVLYPLTLKLPDNAEVILKREKKRNREYDYIELEYPSTPSITFLKNGSLIHGKTSVDLENFVANQDPDKLQNIENHITGSLESLQVTIESLGELFVILQDIAKENRPYLKQASENLAFTTENIRTASYKINTSIREDNISNTFNNVDYSSGNVKETTRNLQEVTENLNQITSSIDKSMPKIDCIISNLAATSSNITDITGGIACTMRKRFGGARVFFGKNEPCCPKGCKR